MRRETEKYLRDIAPLVGMAAGLMSMQPSVTVRHNAAVGDDVITTTEIRWDPAAKKLYDLLTAQINNIRDNLIDRARRMESSLREIISRARAAANSETMFLSEVDVLNAAEKGLGEYAADPSDEWAVWPCGYMCPEAEIEEAMRPPCAMSDDYYMVTVEAYDETGSPCRWSRTVDPKKG